MPGPPAPVALPDSDKQYHIDLARGELAEYILLPGDQDRTAKVAQRFESLLAPAQGVIDEPQLDPRVGVGGGDAPSRLQVLDRGLGTAQTPEQTPQVVARLERVRGERQAGLVFGDGLFVAVD